MSFITIRKTNQLNWPGIDTMVELTDKAKIVFCVFKKLGGDMKVWKRHKLHEMKTTM